MLEPYTPATLVADAVRHLLRQGAPAYDDARGLCLYRDHHGRACAIGGLIPDEEYTESLEPDALGDVLSAIPRARGHELDLVRAASAIQLVHDNWAVVADVEEALKELDKDVPDWRDQLSPDEVTAFIALVSAPPS